ncbi:MAG: cytochrome c oxidase subunit II [Chloroflexota bacterium]
MGSSLLSWARRVGAPKGVLRLIALAVGAALVLSGCGEGANMLDPHGTGARDIATLFWVILWMAVGVFVVVEGILLYAVFRFRSTAGASLPRQVQGNTPLEIAWTIVPTVVLLGVLLATFTTMKAVASPVPNALEVTVTGHQWWWEFDYHQQGVSTAGELHIPVNTDVTLHVMSDDVVHNFWVPELDRKVQAIPGHDNIVPIHATTIGTYHGFCAEFCGLEHALMRFDVIVQSPADYAAWLAGQQAPPTPPATAQEKAGATAFTAHGCPICHQLGANKPAGFPHNGVLVRGPNLTHYGSRGIMAGGVMVNNAHDMQLWLADPNAEKPGNLMTIFINKGTLDAQTVQNLTAYLESLK